MNREELKAAMEALAPTATFEEGGEFLTMTLPSPEAVPLLETLRHREDLKFDYLFCYTCVDWPDHIMVVYFLNSRTHRHDVVVKAKIADRENPEIGSVCHLWGTAELNEDEMYDLFGVRFRNHPNLRRLFMDENWPGYPLRKDYTDENLIKL